MLHVHGNNELIKIMMRGRGEGGGVKCCWEQFGTKKKDTTGGCQSSNLFPTWWVYFIKAITPYASVKHIWIYFKIFCCRHCICFTQLTHILLICSYVMKDIKDNAWVSMNNDFWITGKHIKSWVVIFVYLVSASLPDWRSSSVCIYTLPSINDAYNICHYVFCEMVYIYELYMNYIYELLLLHLFAVKQLLFGNPINEDNHQVASIQGLSLLIWFICSKEWMDNYVLKFSIRVFTNTCLKFKDGLG